MQRRDLFLKLVNDLQNSEQKRAKLRPNCLFVPFFGGLIA